MMQIINLKLVYPEYYHEDLLIEVSDEIADLLLSFRRLENAQSRQRRRNCTTQFDTELIDSIFIARDLRPDELLIESEEHEELHASIAILSETQKRRLNLHFFQGLSLSDIARYEGVSPTAIYLSISRALHQLKSRLKDFQ